MGHTTHIKYLLYIVKVEMKQMDFEVIQMQGWYRFGGKTCSNILLLMPLW